MPSLNTIRQRPTKKTKKKHNRRPAHKPPKRKGGRPYSRGWIELRKKRKEKEKETGGGRLKGAQRKGRARVDFYILRGVGGIFAGRNANVVNQLAHRADKIYYSGLRGNKKNEKLQELVGEFFRLIDTSEMEGQMVGWMDGYRPWNKEVKTLRGKIKERIANNQDRIIRGHSLSFRTLIELELLKRIRPRARKRDREHAAKKQESKSST